MNSETQGGSYFRGRPTRPQTTRGSWRDRGARPKIRLENDRLQHEYSSARNTPRFSNPSRQHNARFSIADDDKKPMKSFVYKYNDGHCLRYIKPDYIEVDPSSNLAAEFSSSLKVIGSYSEDGERNFSMDKSSLLFLKTEFMPDEDSCEKQVDFDLTREINKIKLYTGSPLLGFHNLLTWITSNKEIFTDIMRPQKKIESDIAKKGNFLVLKNVLSRITRLPYEYSADLNIYAVSIHKYTFIVKGDKSEFDTNNPTSIFGHNFEKLMTRETNEEISCNEDYRVVLSGNLDGHKLLYSGATDCAQPDLYDEEAEDMSAFIGLKTTREIDEETSHYFNRFKTLNYYIYSQLLGTNKVIVGFKNETMTSCTVSRLQLYDKKELQEMGKNYWNSELCLSYASNVLSFVKEKCDEAPGKVLHFVKPSKSNEVIFHSGEDQDLDIVPDWFFEELDD